MTRKKKKLVRKKKKTQKPSIWKALTPSAIFAIILGMAIVAVGVYGILTTGKFLAYFSSFLGIVWIVLVVWIAIIKR